LNNLILYPGGETKFSDNGLGILSDVTHCMVTEERNGMFEMEMDYPVSGLHYPDIALRSLILAKPNPVDDPQPFRVYRITRPIGGMVTVYAQHLSYDLAGITIAPFTAGSAPAAMDALKTYAAEPCPFTFWTDKQTVAAMTVRTPESIRALLGGQEGSVLDNYGGEYRFDRYFVRLYGARGRDRGVTIRYGKNLTSLEQDENCAGVYTGVHPFWINSEGDNLVMLPEKILSAPGTYGFTRIKPLDLSSEWQEAPTVAQLRDRAQKYMEENSIGVPKVSLDVSFVQLEQAEEYRDKALLERVELCDTVGIEFPQLGVSAKAKVSKTVYDVLRGRYESVSLGDARASIADTIIGQGRDIAQATTKNDLRQTKTALQQAIDTATMLITGNSGGYVVLHSSAGQKEPDEILIMDQPKIEDAVKVWRWNKEGLGYSKHGYNGPYGLAMTSNGAIVADFITTGSMNAARITAGILQDENSNTQFNLGTGEFTMKKGSISLGKDANGSPNFYVNNSGLLTIKNGLIALGINTNGSYNFSVDNSGYLNSRSGKIGGFNIGSNSIYNDLLRLSSSSLSFKRDDLQIGFFATGGWNNHPEYRGISMELDPDGDYLFWGQSSAGDNVYWSRFAYYRTPPPGSDIGVDLKDYLSLGCDLDGGNHIAHRFWIDPETGGCNKGVNFESDVILIKEMDDDGTAAQWTKKVHVKFKNGMLVEFK